MLSKELQIGKAAEHYVAFDLIMQGYNAFLADQGLPFDIIVALDGGKVLRVQVKGSMKRITTTNNPHPHYRFGLRHGKGTSRMVSVEEVDVVAFVGIDARAVAYMAIDVLTSRQTGGMVQTVDFYIRADPPPGRTYSTGKQRALWGRFIEDYTSFQRSIEGKNDPRRRPQ